MYGAVAGLCLCWLFTFVGVIVRIRMLGVLRVLSFGLYKTVYRHPQKTLIFRLWVKARHKRHFDHCTPHYYRARSSSLPHHRKAEYHLHLAAIKLTRGSSQPLSSKYYFKMEN